MRKQNIIPGTGGNRIFVNDGTGKIHLIVHDEYENVSWQVADAVKEATDGCLSGEVHRNLVELLPYRTARGNFNFLGLVRYRPVCGEGVMATAALVNVPLDLNLAVDFRKPIHIQDRNGSKRIYTFGGNDLIEKVSSDPSAHVDGGAGYDVAFYPKPMADYSVKKQEDGSYLVEDLEGSTDVLVNVETARFEDGSLYLY